MATLTEHHAEQNSRGYVFEGVRWDDYEAMLRIVGDRPIRVTYDQGRLEIRSPLWAHGNPAYLLGRMVDVLVEELDVRCEPADPVTFRRQDLAKGAEPDKSFYFGENAARVCGKRDLILPDDPPPDLVIEVDLTASSLERLPIFASLDIPRGLAPVGRRTSIPSARAREWVPIERAKPGLSRAGRAGGEPVASRGLECR